MKQLTKITLLFCLLISVSCQDESVQELEQIQQAELRFIDGNVVGDGEEDENLIFNADSENLMIADQFFSSDGSSDCTPDIEGLENMLPDTITITTTAKPGTDAYFDLTIDDATGFLSGTEIPAWCVDVDLGLDEGETVDAEVYSSYEELPAESFEFPENFDLVNWILNQDFIGQESPSGLGQYTFGHVQYALWELIDDVNCFNCTFLTYPTGRWNDNANNITLANEIVDLALAQGEGYTPGCGEKMAIVLIPNDRQPLVITKIVEEVPCDDCYGKVTDLTLKWNWHNDHRVRVYQRLGNTWCAAKIFDAVVGEDDHISFSGVNSDGSIGKWAYVFIGNCYYTKFRTDCHLNIGPGYMRGVLEVTAGTSSYGGELCEYEPPHNWCWWW